MGNRKTWIHAVTGLMAANLLTIQPDPVDSVSLVMGIGFAIFAASWFAKSDLTCAYYSRVGMLLVCGVIAIEAYGARAMGPLLLFAGMGLWQAIGMAQITNIEGDENTHVLVKITHASIALVGLVLVFMDVEPGGMMVKLAGMSMLVVAASVLTKNLRKRTLICMLAACVSGTGVTISELSNGNYFLGLLVGGFLLVICGFLIKAIRIVSVN